MTKPLAPGMTKLIERVYNLYVEAVGKPTPRNPDVAEALGVEPFRVDNAVTWLKRHGRITVKGLGGSRTIHIEGIGSTINRSSVGVATRKIVAAEPEYIRVENFSCPRCGVRNCTSHSAGFLTTSANIPAWRAA